MVDAAKGLVYVASISTTVMVCPAMEKKSSSFTAALTTRRRYVFPHCTCSAYVSDRSKT